MIVKRVEDNPRDGVGEGVSLLEAGEFIDDHRVDVGEEREDVLWRVGECSGVRLEGEGRDPAVLCDECERLDRCIIDVEEDVGEEDRLESDRHGRMMHESIFMLFQSCGVVGCGCHVSSSCI